MTHSSQLVRFLRHYGPITTSDNMYDELIQSELDRHGIEPVIHIETARLSDIINNFELDDPKSIILTGTVGDGKTYHSRRVWKYFGGNTNFWQIGEKITNINLPNSQSGLAGKIYV